MADPIVIGAIKDVDSNIRSEVSYLDRNLMNGIAAQSANIIQSGVGLQGQTAGQLNRSTDYLSSALERQTIQSQDLSQMGFKDLKDNVLRSGDFNLNDGRRNTEFAMGESRRSTDQLMNDGRRNSEFLLGDARRSTDQILNDGRRNNEFMINDTRRGTDQIQNESRRNSEFLLGDNRRGTDQIQNEARRNSEFILGDARRGTDQLQNAVERNGTAASLAIANNKSDLYSAIEKAHTDINLNSYNLAKDTISSVERNGTNNALATEKVGSAAVSETLRSSGLVRDLVNHQSSENRSMLGQLSSQIYTHAKDAAVASKDTELKIAEAAFKAQLQGSMVLSDMGKMKSDLERQAAENAALSARDMALLSRDILMSKGEILKNAADNTAAIQIEALRQKDALSCQLHHTYEKLTNLNTDRIRDNLNDYRAENVGLRYHDDWRHRPDIHNNLHSHMGRGFEGGFPNGPRT